jgi:hypothetical protein
MRGLLIGTLHKILLELVRALYLRNVDFSRELEGKRLLEKLERKFEDSIKRILQK